MFNFGSAALLPKFLLGRYMYWLARTERDRTFAAYIEDNRTVEVQELDLTPAQRQALFERLEHNALPQNRHYLYDYFFDNCSSRVRDGIDVDPGRGPARRRRQAPASGTFRSHALPWSPTSPGCISASISPSARASDKPITRWDEGFIPMELRDLLRDVRLPGQPGDPQPGRPAPGQVRTGRSSAPPARPCPPTPPSRLGLFFTAGILVGGLLALLGWLARRRRWARVALGGRQRRAGAGVRAAGTALVFLWAVTDHRVAHANANILQSAPWALALLVYGIKLARGRRGRRPQGLLVAAAAAAASLLGLLGKLVGPH